MDWRGSVKELTDVSPSFGAGVRVSVTVEGVYGQPERVDESSRMTRSSLLCCRQWLGSGGWGGCGSGVGACTKSPELVCARCG